jgi:hypothetical protein
VSSLKQSDDEAAAVAVAPRVTLDSIESKIASEQYTVIDSIMTICVLKMANGFYVTGESAPASPANFNAELGRKFAREQAIRKVWGFEGYALREKLHAAA